MKASHAGSFASPQRHPDRRQKTAILSLVKLLARQAAREAFEEPTKLTETPEEARDGRG
jgi:hypothetical protein